MTDYEDGYFKAYAPIVVKAFDEMDNYLIEDNGKDTGVCCIYFSSHGIYFPSDKETFEKEIIQKNRFKFYGKRLPQCSRHIFLRDIHKQWYLQGINKRYNTIEKVAAFLKEKTEGYKIITIGSSAGGYAAALFATLLEAEYAICIDARFNISDETVMNHLEKNPIVDALKDTEVKKYFNLNSILGDTPIYYFHSAYSPLDKRLGAAIKGNKAIHEILFKSNRHGNPFSSVLYEHVFGMPPSRLDKLRGRIHHPKLFLLRYAFHPKVARKIIKKFI